MPPRRLAPTGDPALKTPERRTLRERIRALGLPCQHPACRLPGIPINYTPGARGPDAYVLDEIIPRVLGGSPVDPTNTRPVHRRCNASAGADITNALRRLKSTHRRPATAQRW